ncbi:MAG: hypothetical protein HRT90_02290 [Candidatus Margulisbacteria bacterium]|nr:hypothetical protein [Candidatus Margulisiibacteriota bacterium]
MGLIQKIGLRREGPNKLFHCFLKNCLNDAETKQADLARKLGTSRKNVNHWVVDRFPTSGQLFGTLSHLRLNKRDEIALLKSYVYYKSSINVRAVLDRLIQLGEF